jgi:adenylosuccinate lyase
MAEKEAVLRAYQNPLAERYASAEMLYLFSPHFKFSMWRRLWVALAEAEKELGLPIQQSQISQMKKNVDNINFEQAAEFEKKFRHDVMAHVHAYGEQCPEARPIIHLGATSAYVGDNTDLLQIREAFGLILKKLVNLIDGLADFAGRFGGVPTLGYTHFQAAQPTTVGKRACLWIQDLIMDLEEVESFLGSLKFLGVKGTTGTQASFLKLFDGDADKVKRLDEMVTRRMGFKEAFPVAGQTYPRKVDARALAVLAGIAQSAHKFGNDLRLLSHLKEIEEPYEKTQIGSSAMPYKRNPMRAERMTALARFLIANYQNAAMTAAEQWFERTLDDSANRRLSIAQGFLAADAVLNIYLNICRGLIVNEAIIKKHLEEELPFIASENILMAAVKAGGDRQRLHEKIMRHAREAASRVKVQGKSNDLLDRIRNDAAFAMVKDEVENLSDPSRCVGLAAEQVKDFSEKCVRPMLKKHKRLLGSVEAEMHV